MAQSFQHSLEKRNAKGILTQFADFFDAEISKDCNRHHIDLPDDYGNGQIVIYESQHGMDAIIIRARPAENWNIHFSGQMRDPIFFYTVAQGTVRATSPRFSFAINPLQSTIHGGFGPTDYQLTFPAGEDIFCLLITIDKQLFFKQMSCDSLHVPTELLEVIVNLNRVDTNFIFQDIYHLPLVNTLTDIMEQEHVGLLNSTFAASKLYENVYLQLRIYQKHEEEENIRIYRDEEKIKIIRNAESILVSRLQDPPTIPELARMVGTNMQTLKQGFRQIFGATINQHLNEKRLEQAGILMKAGELSLREIALSVGYANASYFSKRFKDKYGVNPRNFKQIGGNSAPVG